MKSIILLCLVFVLFSCKQHQEKQAKLQMTETLNFGKLPYNKSLEIKHKVFNANDKDVRILRLTNDCYCLEGKLRDSVIKPGESGVIDIVYTPTRSRDTGHVVKFISFRTDTDDPIQTFYLKGEIVK